MPGGRAGLYTEAQGRRQPRKTQVPGASDRPRLPPPWAPERPGSPPRGPGRAAAGGDREQEASERGPARQAQGWCPPCALRLSTAQLTPGCKREHPSDTRAHPAQLPGHTQQLCAVPWQLRPRSGCQHGSRQPHGPLQCKLRFIESKSPHFLRHMSHSSSAEEPIQRGLPHGLVHGSAGETGSSRPGVRDASKWDTSCFGAWEVLTCMSRGAKAHPPSPPLPWTLLLPREQLAACEGVCTSEERWPTAASPAPVHKESRAEGPGALHISHDAGDFSPRKPGGQAQGAGARGFPMPCPGAEEPAQGQALGFFAWTPAVHSPWPEL